MGEPALDLDVIRIELNVNISELKKAVKNLDFHTINKLMDQIAEEIKILELNGMKIDTQKKDYTALLVKITEIKEEEKKWPLN